jgi:SNF family Na+-dependent transporter
VLLIILLIYGCTLPGAADGIRAFFVPRKWSGESSIQVSCNSLSLYLRHSYLRRAIFL